MNTNASLDLLSRIDYGRTLNGSHQSLKIRLSHFKAKHFVKELGRFSECLKIYNAKKAVIIGMTEPVNNTAFWSKVRDAQDAIHVLVEPKQLVLKGM